MVMLVDMLMRLEILSLGLGLIHLSGFYVYFIQVSLSPYIPVQK